MCFHVVHARCQPGALKCSRRIWRRGSFLLPLERAESPDQDYREDPVEEPRSQRRCYPKSSAKVRYWLQLVHDIVSMLRGNCHFLPTQPDTQMSVGGGLTYWVTKKHSEYCLAIDRQRGGILAGYPDTLSCPSVLALARLDLTGVTWREMGLTLVSFSNGYCGS